MPTSQGGIYIVDVVELATYFKRFRETSPPLNGGFI